jgi:hypothetical protein
MQRAFEQPWLVMGPITILLTVCGNSRMMKCWRCTPSLLLDFAASKVASEVITECTGLPLKLQKPLTEIIKAFSSTMGSKQWWQKKEIQDLIREVKST